MIGRGVALLVMFGGVITRCSADHSTFDVTPPDRLDIIYPIGTTVAQAQADCLSGELIALSTSPLVLVCEGVDY